MYKMPRLKTLAELDPSSASASLELTKRALSTLQTDDKEGENSRGVTL